KGKARIAYLAADLDRRYGRENLPDHGDLLANLLRWVTADHIPFELHGLGLIDCHLYRQPGRVIVHLVNLTNAGTWRAPVDELIPVGPLEIRLRLPNDVPGRRAQFLVSIARAAVTNRQGWAVVEMKSIADHEVLVI